MTKANEKKPTAKASTPSKGKVVEKKPAAKAVAKPVAKTPAKPVVKSKTVEKVFDTKSTKKPSKPVVTTASLAEKFQQGILDTFS